MTRILHALLPCLLALPACVRTIATQEPRAPSDPTHGICASGPPAPQSSIHSALDLAMQAKHRGCSNEAAAYLDPLGRGVDALSEEDRVRLAVVSADVIYSIYELGYDGRGVSSIDYPEDRPTFNTGVFAKFGDVWKTMYALHEAGKVPRDMITSGQLFRVMTRPVFSSCLAVGDKSLRKRIRTWALPALRNVIALAYPDRIVATIEDAGALSGIAEMNASACAYKPVAELLRLAAALHRRRQDESSAQAVDLLEIEISSFLGGRATELDMRLLDSKAHEEEAAELLAAAVGTGRRYEQGVKLERALDSWESKQPTLSTNVRTRLLWLRAAGAWAMRANATEAVTLARQLRSAAVEVRRADLLDASRVIEALASADLGQWQAVASLLGELDASFAARGVVGARFRLDQQLARQARRFMSMGRGQDAIRMVLAASPIVERTPLNNRLLYGILQVQLLEELGRHEEAFTLINQLIAEHQRRRSEIAHDRDYLHRRLLSNRYNLASALGLDDERLDASDEKYENWAPLARAFAQGDTSLIRAILASNDTLVEDALRDSRAVLLDEGYCHGVFDMLMPFLEEAVALAKRVDSPDPAEVLRLDPVLEPQEFEGAILGMIPTLAHCGAQLGDPALVEAAFRYSTATTSLKSRMSVEYERIVEASAASVTGNHGYAARVYLDIGRSIHRAPGISVSGAVGQSQQSGKYFRRAAMEALRGTTPYVAFAVSALEEARARDLRALRATREQRSHGITGALETIERALSEQQNQLRALVQLQAAATDPRTKAAIAARVADITRKIEATEADRKQTIRRLAEADPSGYRAAALAPPPTILDLQSRLARDETALYFLIEAERAVAIVVDDHDARVIDLPALDESGFGVLSLEIRRLKHLLDQRTGSVVRGLQWVDGDSARSSDIARIDTEIETLRDDLYRRMIRPLEPVLPAGRRVIIMPDETTADLPFAALGTGSSSWISRNPLRILPGAYLLEAPTRTRPRIESALVIGDPDFGPTARRILAVRGGQTAAGTSFSPLAGTRREATSVADLYGVRPLIGRSATEEAIRAQIERASILHFATHGFAHHNDPDRSALVLAIPGKRSRADGLLYGFEVQNLSLSADLVVLSACETGRGKTRGVEGVLALDRAFLVAGARTVVSSMWLVPDASTAALMTEFHRGLAAGEAADVALARAMLFVQRQPGWEHPRYWSGFRVVGAGLR